MTQNPFRIYIQVHTPEPVVSHRKQLRACERSTATSIFQMRKLRHRVVTTLPSDHTAQQRLGTRALPLGSPWPHAGTLVAGSGRSVRSPAPLHPARQGTGTTSLCLRFWYLAEKACKAQAKNKGSNKSLLLVNYSVSHYCLKPP